MEKKLQPKPGAKNQKQFLTQKEKDERQRLRERKRAYYQERAIIRTEKERFLKQKKKDNRTIEEERELALK